MNSLCVHIMHTERTSVHEQTCVYIICMCYPLSSLIFSLSLPFLRIRVDTAQNTVYFWWQYRATAREIQAEKKKERRPAWYHQLTTTNKLQCIIQKYCWITCSAFFFFFGLTECACVSTMPLLPHCSLANNCYSDFLKEIFFCHLFKIFDILLLMLCKMIQ